MQILGLEKMSLVDYDGLVVASPELTLPHPRAGERRFVTEPLRRLGITLRFSL